MNNLPPLPDTLTLKEAAQAMTERTGIEWTERQILGRAVHHEIQINARIGHAVRLIRNEPIEGEENEINAPAGCLPPLSSKAVRALLNADEAGFDGWEHPKTVSFFGKPAVSWVMEFELAPGEVPPVVHFDNCRVIDCSLLQLADTYKKQPAPATDTATPAPVEDVGALGEPDKAGPVDKGWVMKKAALIAKHANQWPTIARDFQDAPDNKLKSAAKAPGHGEWFEAAALDWARQRGKLTEEKQQGPANSVFSLAGTKHTIKG